jgi:hypothetical protein
MRQLDSTLHRAKVLAAVSAELAANRSFTALAIADLALPLATATLSESYRGLVRCQWGGGQYGQT